MTVPSSATPKRMVIRRRKDTPPPRDLTSKYRVTGHTIANGVIRINAVHLKTKLPRTFTVK